MLGQAVASDHAPAWIFAQTISVTAPCKSIPCRRGPHGAWSDIETIPAALRYHERKRFTFLVIEVGVSQDSVVRDGNLQLPWCPELAVKLSILPARTGLQFFSGLEISNERSPGARKVPARGA